MKEQIILILASAIITQVVIQIISLFKSAHSTYKELGMITQQVHKLQKDINECHNRTRLCLNEIARIKNKIIEIHGSDGLID